MNAKARTLILLLIVGALGVAGLQFDAHHHAVVGAAATVCGQATEQTAGSNITAIANMTSFSGALAWVQSAGYFLMFLAMVVEGPVVTSAAAFACALGYFNIFAVLILSILGDVVGDFIYYAIGYFGRVAFVEKYGHKVGLTTKRIQHIERLIKEHPKKTLTAIKLAPMLPAPGLMMIGAAKMPLRRYAWMTFLVALPKTVLFMVLGYYFGRAYDTISAQIQNGGYFILIALLIIVLAFYAYKKIAEKVSLQLETI